MTRERRPTSREWREIDPPSFLRGDPNVTALSMWQRASVRAISTVTIAELPDGSGKAGPQWHASVSRLGKRPKARDVEHFLRDFGLVGAEEDNHHPGGARHYWMSLDPGSRGQCECKTTETVIVERDGYEWTNPTDEPCRGCEFGRLRGRPCPIHGTGATA